MTDTITLKQAVGIILEGFTLPDAARKILETAYFAESAIAQQAEPAPAAWKTQFLSDALTAAGMIAYGRIDKKMAERLSAGVVKFRSELFARPQVAQQAEQDEVGINGLTAAETRATMSVAGLSEPTKLTSYERKCFNDWKNP